MNTLNPTPEDTNTSRPLKELYPLILDKLINWEQYNEYFICNIIINLHKTLDITNDEYEILLSHFTSQRPTENLHSEIYNIDLFDKKHISGAWFTYIPNRPINPQEFVDARIQLIQAIINTL